MFSNETVYFNVLFSFSLFRLCIFVNFVGNSVSSVGASYASLHADLAHGRPRPISQADRTPLSRTAGSGAKVRCFFFQVSICKVSIDILLAQIRGCCPFIPLLPPVVSRASRFPCSVKTLHKSSSLCPTWMRPLSCKKQEQWSNIPLGLIYGFPALQRMAGACSLGSAFLFQLPWLLPWPLPSLFSSFFNAQSI